MTNESDEPAQLLPRPNCEPKTEIAQSRRSILCSESDPAIKDRSRSGAPISLPVACLLSRLERVRSARGRGFVAKCPAHVDQVPSLSISEGRDGRVLVYCFAGCDTAAVLSAIGLSFPDLFRERR
jgi:hypothetical protein